MDNYEFTSDRIDSRGFISKEQILDVVSQEDIFSLVFGEVPEDFVYITSPFRADSNPGCWFEYYVDGKLRFIDFGNSTRINGISMTNIDCFDAVQVYYKLPNFYLTLEFIHNSLIKGKPLVKIDRHFPEREIKPVKILTEARPFENRDGNFWFSGYGITKNQLIEDKVIPFSRFHILNTKKGNISSHCFDIGFSFNDFPNGRKKLYFPHRQKDNRFLTTCTKDDIGGINSLAPFGRLLVITKSYKDWRVLKNLGRHTVWFQNEGMIPDISILTLLVRRFEKVVVFFDNDNPGIEAATTVTAVINSVLPGKARPFWLPEELLLQRITDPSDFYFCKGGQELQSLLNTYKL